jgi:hypothetical protein
MFSSAQMKYCIDFTGIMKCLTPGSSLATIMRFGAERRGAAQSERTEPPHTDISWEYDLEQVIKSTLFPSYNTFSSFLGLVKRQLKRSECDLFLSQAAGEMNPKEVQ